MNPHCSPTQASTSVPGYVQHGAGPECVLVMHDWLGDHTNYESVMPYLDGAAFTYVFVDLRGYGKSIHMRGDYNVQEIAADCLKLANQLGWHRFHLIGHSMTGMATQRIAADAPDRIRSAIAVCPISAAGNQLNEEALRFFSSTCENDDAFRRLVKFVTGGLSDRWANVKLRQNRERVAPECRSGYLQMLSTTHFVEDVRGLETPYLVRALLLAQRRQSLLAGRQVIAVKYAQTPARHTGGNRPRREHRLQTLRATLYQGTQDRGFGAFDLLIQRGQRHRQVH